MPRVTISAAITAVVNETSLCGSVFSLACLSSGFVPLGIV